MRTALAADQRVRVVLEEPEALVSDEHDSVRTELALNSPQFSAAGSGLSRNQARTMFGIFYIRHVWKRYNQPQDGCESEG